jgi:hypothetical protein
MRKLNKEEQRIISESTLIYSDRGRAVGPRVNDTYRTRDGRLFRVVYYIGKLAQVGYVEKASDQLPVARVGV